MNSHIWKCSRCKKHTNIDLKGDLININCQCGYHSTMKIKEYINHHKIDKSYTSIYNDTFKYVTTDIKKANEHLFTYFKRIKDENKERINKYINRLIELLSELESSYEESYNRNKNMVLVIIHFVYGICQHINV